MKSNIMKTPKTVNYFRFNQHIYCVLCWCILTLCLSCSNSGKQVSNIEKFTNKVTLIPQVKYITGCSNQIDIVELNDYYIIQNDVEAHQMQLSVYNKKTNQFLYGFAPKGHGKHETLAMDMVQNSKGDTLEIIDQSKYKILKYKINNDKADFISEKFIDVPAVGALQEVYRHSDSIIVFNTLDGNLQTYNDSTNKTISVYNFCDSLGLQKDKRDIANFHFAYYNNKVSIGFRHFNSIIAGDIDHNGKIVIQDINNIKKMSSDSDVNMIYYAYVSMNGDYVIAQYMGYAPGFIKKTAFNYNLFSPKFEIEIYSNDLNPYKHVIPKTDILRCKIANKGKCFYSWNPLDSKENILIFNF